MMSEPAWTMEQFLVVLGIVAVLGSALVGGIFYAFSSFVMTALAELPYAAGIGVMQSINIVVLNRSFLALFFGTAVLSLLAGGIALAEWDRPGAGYYFAAGSFYFLGTFGVTALGNVPLNDELASVSVTDHGARDLWEHYLGVWTMWNLLRTLAAMIAALLFLLGLIQNVRV